jgi:hypothetical protein
MKRCNIKRMVLSGLGMIVLATGAASYASAQDLNTFALQMAAQRAQRIANGQEAVGGELGAVLRSLNTQMGQAAIALNPNTSMEELARIRRQYAGWAERMSGSVSEMETRTRLAKRWQQERAARQRAEAIQQAQEAERQAKAVQAYVDWVLRNSR